MKIFLIVLNTLADWEIGYLTAELHSKRLFADQSIACSIVKVGLSAEPIATMGGMLITPDITLDQVRMESHDLLLMPGGENWLEPESRPVLDFAKAMLDEGFRVAAICGAVEGLAQVGALDKRKHTGNDKAGMKASCTGYTGEQRYLDQAAVRDGNLVTATGLAPLEFSYETLKLLDVLRPATLEAWFQLHKAREPQYFHALMASMSA
jgi:putative intracellular protease/amidase